MDTDAADYSDSSCRRVDFPGQGLPRISSMARIPPSPVLALLFASVGGGK